MTRTFNWLAYLVFCYAMPNWLGADGWRWRVYLWFVDRAGRHAYGDQS